MWYQSSSRMRKAISRGEGSPVWGFRFRIGELNICERWEPFWCRLPEPKQEEKQHGWRLRAHSKKGVHAWYKVLENKQGAIHVQYMSGCILAWKLKAQE